MKRSSQAIELRTTVLFPHAAFYPQSSYVCCTLCGNRRYDHFLSWNYRSKWLDVKCSEIQLVFYHSGTVSCWIVDTGDFVIEQFKSMQYILFNDLMKGPNGGLMYFVLKLFDYWSGYINDHFVVISNVNFELTLMTTTGAFTWPVWRIKKWRWLTQIILAVFNKCFRH